MTARCVAVVTLVALTLVAPGCSRQTAEEAALSGRLDAADELFRSRSYEEAGALYEGIAEDAMTAGDMSAYVEACAMRARSHLIVNRADEGRPWLDRAAEHANSEDALGWSRYLGVRGRFEWRDGDVETATQTFVEMFNYCRAAELWSRAVDAAHMVAITGDEDERFAWSHRGIEMAEAGELTGWLGPLWNNLGWNYVEAGRHDEAVEALLKAREYHYQGEQELPKLIADWSVGHALRLGGRLEDARDEIEPVLGRALTMHREGHPDALEWVGFSRWELGELAVAEGDAERGVQMLEDAADELRDAGMPDWDAAGWSEKQDRLTELAGGDLPTSDRR
jgi:tetratricopeptide (TPR) repeat protein